MDRNTSSPDARGGDRLIFIWKLEATHHSTLSKLRVSTYVAKARSYVCVFFLARCRPALDSATTIDQLDLIGPE